MFEGFYRGCHEGGDVTINYVKAGNGPPVLLLHGFPQNLAMWAEIAPRLAEHYTVVCADLRGYGDSGKPVGSANNANYAFREMAQDNIGLMRALGFEQFHMIGHDRGGRTGHRMALDHPDAVATLCILDIVPTHTMLTKVDRHVASAYWHWYFLSQPAPFPERMIASDPDFFYETCLLGWGATALDAFVPEQLAEYRRCWRDPLMIHGSCSDYRAAASIDLEHDVASIDQMVECPSLVLFGTDGVMARCFDIPETWRSKLQNMESDGLPGGHFFVDHYPNETTDRVLAFLADNCL